MGRRKPQMRPPASAQATSDSFQNFEARVGLGTDNQNSGSTYGFSPISRNRLKLEWAYRSSWIVGQVVDVVADDMTREGVTLTGDIDPEYIEKLEQAAVNLDIWNQTRDLIRWARLYGGAVGVLMIDGQDVSTPFKPETVGKDQFKGILVLDRWLVQPSLENLVTEFGPNIGKPKYYTVIADAQALVNMKIHYSRVIRLDGVTLPYWQKIAENGWGQSVVERLWDRIIPFDSITEGASQLVYKAHLRTYKVEGLREIIAAGGKALEGLTKQIDMIRRFQSNEGMTLMDTKDEFEAHSYTFSGLDSLMLQFGQQISGATGIPLVRLFGQSPAGMNATGESDVRNYYDNIKQQQERMLKHGLDTVFEVMYRSVFDEEPPENFGIEFNSLWQLSDTEKATIAQNMTTAIVGAYDAQIIDRATALKELRKTSSTTGVFSQITDEQVTEAENEPQAPSAEDLGITNANPIAEQINAGQTNAGQKEAEKPGQVSAPRAAILRSA